MKADQVPLVLAAAGLGGDALYTNLESIQVKADQVPLVLAAAGLGGDVLHAL